MRVLFPENSQGDSGRALEVELPRKTTSNGIVRLGGEVLKHKCVVPTQEEWPEEELVERLSHAMVIEQIWMGGTHR